MGKLDPLVYAINSYGFTVDFSLWTQCFGQIYPRLLRSLKARWKVIGEIDKTDLVFSGEDTDEEVAKKYIT